MNFFIKNFCNTYKLIKGKMRKLFSYSKFSNNFIPKNYWKVFLKPAIEKLLVTTKNQVWPTINNFFHHG